MTYYTYLWLREKDGTFPAGTPYYAGKGSGNRAFVKDDHRFNPPEDAENVIIQFWPDEQTAFDAEIFLIAYYGRIDDGTGCLRNLTDGGENPPICKGHSEESKAKLSEALKGNTNGAAGKGVTRNVGRPCPKKAIEHITNLYKGKKLSEEHKMKLSQAAKARSSSSEARALLAERGRKGAAARWGGSYE